MSEYCDIAKYRERTAQIGIELASPGVHDVAPVLLRPRRQLLEPLDQQHARVADVAAAPRSCRRVREPEAAREELLVLEAGREPRAARLGAADAAAEAGAVHQPLVQRGHRTEVTT